MGHLNCLIYEYMLVVRNLIFVFSFGGNMKRVCLIILFLFLGNHFDSCASSFLYGSGTLFSSFKKTVPTLFSRLPSCSSQNKTRSFFAFTAFAGATIYGLIKFARWALRPADTIILECSGKDYESAINSYEALLFIMRDAYVTTTKAVASIPHISENLLVTLATKTNTHDFNAYTTSLDAIVDKLESHRRLVFERKKALQQKNPELSTLMEKRFEQLNIYVKELRDLRALVHYYSADFEHIMLYHVAINSLNQKHEYHKVFFHLINDIDCINESALQQCALSLSMPLSDYVQKLKDDCKQLAQDIEKVGNMKRLINVNHLPELPSATDTLEKSLVEMKKNLDKLDAFFDKNQNYFRLAEVCNNFEEHRKNAQRNFVPGGTMYKHVDYASILDRDHSILTGYLKKTMCYADLYAHASQLAMTINVFSSQIKASPQHAQELKERTAEQIERERVEEIRRKRRAKEQLVIEQKRLVAEQETANRLAASALVAQQTLIEVQRRANHLKEQKLAVIARRSAAAVQH